MREEIEATIRASFWRNRYVLALAEQKEVKHRLKIFEANYKNVLERLINQPVSAIEACHGDIIIYE